MEKLLDQEQINAMFRARREEGNRTASYSEGPILVVKEYDLRHPHQLTREQVKSITSLHERVGRNLEHSMGAYLRVLFETSVVSVEQLTYGEFLGRVPDVTYSCSLNVAPMCATAVLQLDLQLAFPLIDILLGGQGRPVTELREATEIEEQVLEGIVRLIAKELDAEWAETGMKIAFEERRLAGSLQRLFTPGEKTLVISFEARIPETRGCIHLAFPAVVANTLMRTLARESAPKAKSVSHSEVQLRQLLLECEFVLALRTPVLRVPFREVLSLEPDSVLRLPYAVSEPLIVAVGDQEIFQARAVRTTRWRGAQLNGTSHDVAGAESEKENAK
jgi:flagellar motor switch protein FliM